jgi:hypothetical protein
VNINDIKKLKSFGNYSVDYPLNHLRDTIDRWVKEDGLQLNPDFQRGHVWTEEQSIAFVEFILRGGKTSPMLLNHPGWMSSFAGKFVCVDGLQRLTALLRFLKNDLPVFGGHYCEDIEKIELLLRGISLNFYINELKTREEVIEWYLELNAGGTPHSKEELDRVAQLLLEENPYV